MDPLEILPKEMWAQILDNIQDGEDVLSAYSTCRLWKSLLHNKRTTWMFSAVFPHLFNYLPKEDILNSRLVCKRWSTGIEKYLEEGQPTHQIAGGNGLNAQHSCTRSLDVNISRCSTVRKMQLSPAQALQYFQTQFEEESSKNPFLSRSLHLYGSSNLELQTILDIFKLHGHHIWTLNLKSWVIPFLTPLDAASFLWQLLRSAPNLKKLILHLTVRDYFLLKREEILVLDKFLEENPAPPLIHLKNMELFVNMKPIKDKMLAAYTHQLNMYSEFGDPQYKYELLINLKNLTWTFQNSNDVDLEKITSLNCPSLEQLSINLKDASPAKTACANCTTGKLTSRLFTAIERFGESLKKLNIYWRVFIREEIPDHIHLPHLQEICLEFNTGSPINLNLTFLESLKNLKKVKLIFWANFYEQVISMNLKQQTKAGLQYSQQQEGVKEKIDLLYHLDPEEVILRAGYNGSNTTRKPYNSNIWRLIPSLEVIAVKVYYGLGFLCGRSADNARCPIYTRREFNEKYFLQ